MNELLGLVKNVLYDSPALFDEFISLVNENKSSVYTIVYIR